MKQFIAILISLSLLLPIVSCDKKHTQESIDYFDELKYILREYGEKYSANIGNNGDIAYISLVDDNLIEIVYKNEIAPSGNFYNRYDLYTIKIRRSSISTHKYDWEYYSTNCANLDGTQTSGKIQGILSAEEFPTQSSMEVTYSYFFKGKGIDSKLQIIYQSLDNVLKYAFLPMLKNSNKDLDLQDFGFYNY